MLINDHRFQDYKDFTRLIIYFNMKSVKVVKKIRISFLSPL